MIDRKWIGYTSTPSKVTIDRWRVKLFCQAIGETDALYWDEAAARVAGHAACPVPPTFLKAIEADHMPAADLLGLLGVPLLSVLHAEQSFDYLAPVHVGDEIEITREVTDIYEKRGGALEFVVVEALFRRGAVTVCESRQTIVVRRDRAAAR